MIDKIKEWFKVHSRKTEAQTDRDGFLSYAGEFHALAIGLGIGMYAAISKDPELVKAMLAISLGLGGSSEAKRRVRNALDKAGVEEKGESAIGEVVREPWYAAGGVMIAFIASSIVLYGVDYIQSVGANIV